MAGVSFEIKDDVAIVRMDVPPGNHMTQGLRSAIIEVFDDLSDYPDVKSVVLTGVGISFSMGLDLRELERPAGRPSMAEVCAKVEGFDRPVVAVLHGITQGSGLELALACHGRVAQADARIAMPDVAMGMIPSAGGTQRLPRLIGAARALEILMSGRLYSIRAAQCEGIADEVVSADVMSSALARARVLAGAGLIATRDREDGFSDPSGYQAALKAARSGSRDWVAGRISDCVEAAQLLPFDGGLEFEAAAAEDCLDSDLSRALRHMFFAERRGEKMPEVAGVSTQGVQVLGVVGGGIAASMIVVAAINVGLRVVQFERSAEAQEAARARVEGLLRQIGDGAGLTASALSLRMGLLQSTHVLSDLGQADAIIEAVADNADTKAQVFAALNAVAKKDAIFMTNSLVLPIEPMAAASGRPGQVLGMHLHGPAYSNRLAELTIDGQTDPVAIARAIGLAQRMGKFSMRGGAGAGGIGERITAALRDSLWGMIRRGVAPMAIDNAMRGYGFAAGPLQFMDAVGLDVCLTRMKMMAGVGRVASSHTAALEVLVDAGRLGEKSGAGFYDWSAGGEAPQDDPSLGTVLSGVTQNGGSLRGNEIVMRALAAMANEGARLLRENVALRPSDIDTVMVHAYHFPRAKGGPMKAADLIGLFEMGRLLTVLQKEDATLYDPDPGFAALSRNGEDFEVLNKRVLNRRHIPG